MKIGIYKDTYGPVIGGTEYSVAVLAEALQESHEVEVILSQHWLTKEHFANLFGTPLGGVRLRYIERKPRPPGKGRTPWSRLRNAQAWQAELSQPYDFFLNFIHAEPPFCHAPVGMFCVLFPFYDRSKDWPNDPDSSSRSSAFKQKLRQRYADWEWRKRMDSYRIKSSNSAFTAKWAKIRYGIDCQVFHPPVETAFRVVDKENIILSVGRYTPIKKQLEMVATFRQMTALHARGWRLICVGPISEDEPPLYLDAVRSLAAGFPIELLGSVSHEELTSLYERAKLFWHATGYGVDDNRTPEYTEHFGIVTAEAMGAGCVPVVHNKGGQPEIVEQENNGFLWTTLEELQGYTMLLAANDAVRVQIGENARGRAKLFTKERFVERFFELAPEVPA
jgi:glycosyltransferase involved in cell wall biosynthesis